MAFAKLLQRYDAFLYPNNGKESGRINLYCEDYKLYLIFHDPSEVLPPNTFDATARIGVAHQTFSQYEHFLDLVRNEKPIYVTFMTEATPPGYVVYCADETPGEGEI